MTESLTANGNTYNDGPYDATTNAKGFANAGHRVNLFPALRDILADATTGLSGVSTTSMAIGSGTKSPVLSVAKEIKVGAWLTIVYDASNWMFGQLTARTGATLTVNVTQHAGAGTYDNWSIYVSAPQPSAVTFDEGLAVLMAEAFA